MLPLCLALCAIVFGSDLAARAENQGPTPEAFILRKLGEYQATTERLKASYVKKCGSLPMDTEVTRDTGGQKPPDRTKAKLKAIPYEVKIVRVIPGSGNNPLDKDDPIQGGGSCAVPITAPLAGGAVMSVAYDPVNCRFTSSGDANAAVDILTGVGEPGGSYAAQIASWNGYSWNKPATIYALFNNTCTVIVSKGGSSWTIVFKSDGMYATVTSVTGN